MNLGMEISPQRLSSGSEQDQPKKMDILFYDSINNLKSIYNKSIVYHFIKALIFIIFIPIDYTVINSPNDGKILTAMIIALVVSVLEVGSESLFRFIPLRNNKLLLKLATGLNHHTDQLIYSNQDKRLHKDHKPLKQQQQTATINKHKLQILQNCVSSTIYNKQNQTLIDNQGLTYDIKKMYVRVLVPNIKQTIKRQEQCLGKIDNFVGFLGFAAFVYAIVALAVSQINTPQLVLLIVYIVLEGFSKILVILILILMAISPIICCLLCCCVCFCSGDAEGAAKLPDAQRATEKMINDADGTCSICYQSFIVNENVIRLRCSPMHMFHPLCIQSWTKLRPTCPICRASVRENVNRPPVAE